MAAEEEVENDDGEDKGEEDDDDEVDDTDKPLEQHLFGSRIFSKIFNNSTAEGLVSGAMRQHFRKTSRQSGSGISWRG